jgi:hypothetical protein
MQKGQQVVLWVLAYCIVSWLGRGLGVAPSPLIAPARVAELFTPEPRRADGRFAVAPRFTRPMQELISVPEATAAEEEPAPKPTTWDGFVAKLRSLENGGRDKVRVIHLGDSELVADGTAGAMRRILAERFGLGGLGFSLPMLPLPWYLREHLQIKEGVGVRVFSYPHGRLLGGMYGPGGVAFDAAPGAHGWVEATHPVSGPCTIALFFSHQPKGGSIQVIGDGKLVLEASTVGTWGLGKRAQRADPCPRELELTTTKRQTRVYGWSIEYDQPGIVWSNLGVVSAQIPQLDHFAAGHLAQAMGALSPDLVVLTYGLNIAASPSLPPATYRFVVEDQIRRIREGTPNAACLVTGPYPVGHPRKDTGHNPESRNAGLITEAQREAAQAAGCVFVDRYHLAGGAPTAQRWVATRPKILSGDYHHLTVEGGERMGRALASVILSAVDGAPVDPMMFRLHRQDGDAGGGGAR